MQKYIQIIEIFAMKWMFAVHLYNQTIFEFAHYQSHSCGVMKLAAMPSCLGGEEFGINVV